MLTREAQNDLAACDWTAIGKQLVFHAFSKLEKSMIGGRLTSVEQRRDLAEEFAKDAIVSVLDGGRKWDPERHPCLTKFLRDVVDSKISHFLNGGQNRWEGPPPGDDFETGVCDDPDSELIFQDIRRRLADPELVELLDALWQGYETSGELADRLQITASEAVNRRKRLRRRVAELGYCAQEMEY